MPPKTNKTENITKNVKKQINTTVNDLTERTEKEILEKFTDEQLAEFRDLFNMFDKDNQGFLTIFSLLSVMKTVGQTPTESDMIDLMREMDIDNSGTIDFYEFVKVISHRMNANENQQEIRHAFNLFDENHDGSITLDDLKSSVKKYLNLLLNDIELRQMIDLADRHRSNSVSFDDFLRASLCRSNRKSSDIRHSFSF